MPAQVAPGFLQATDHHAVEAEEEVAGQQQRGGDDAGHPHRLLALRGLTLGTSGASAEVPTASAWDGLNFLWTPQFDSLSNPKVWLAAAGQIFFTLSVGMGTIHCYAAYVKSKDDIALNAVSAGFTNEFVEVVLGSLIVIPIAAGYLGLDWVKENAGFGMAFQTMPFLFEKWGPVLSAVAGVMWFGLLFFAGITSSLAMGTPWMGFMRDEFGWGRTKGAWSFGAIVLVLGLPTVIFFQEGVFDEYDYWAGTVALVVFALAETILFSWVFGIDKGWKELMSGSDLNVPTIYKFIIKYITPLLLLLVFLGALFTPLGNEWTAAFKNLFSGGGWSLDNSSIIKTIANTGLHQQLATATDPADVTRLQDRLFYTNFARVLLTLTFAGLALLVYIAALRRIRNTSTTSA